MAVLKRRAEIHLFLLWSEARRAEAAILADIRQHFRVLEVVEVVWTPGPTFARNLSRMYMDRLPPGSHKEMHCGSGPMLAVVVEDIRPRYRVRGHRRQLKWVNSNVFDARQRYRMWTGDGHRVHASDSRTEIERNLMMIFGETPENFRERAPGADVRSRHEADLLGADGWRSTEELVRAIEMHDARVTAGPKDDRQLVVLARDVWWARTVANGREVDEETTDVRVGDDVVRLRVLPDPEATSQDGARARLVRAARGLLSSVRPTG
ncbi:hypothetical protein [Geodermatophilus amargosae]|uniref:hypothetical protein n=1 Tax=Geodermatophilus amargosae TaxID=1296565 RepID=UPI001114EC54|nr:hypothetical protein [Geodermatophilus amargosae]